MEVIIIQNIFDGRKEKILLLDIIRALKKLMTAVEKILVILCTIVENMAFSPI